MEQTGSTIFQTFAGLFLDKVKNNDAEVRLEDGPTSKAAVQQLLNLFLFLNVCQFASIVFLWILDRRRKQQAEIAAAANAATDESADDDFNIIEEEEQPKRHSRRLSLSKQESVSVPESHCLERRDSNLSSHSPVVPFLEASASASPYDHHEPEEERPLLGDDILPWHGDKEEPIAGEARTKSEVLRGEICGVLCICLICFAWVFFISTAFFRLRSKEDRKGS